MLSALNEIMGISGKDPRFGQWLQGATEDDTLWDEATVVLCCSFSVIPAFLDFLLVLFVCVCVCVCF